MNTTRHLLLAAYYYGTLPYRKWALRRLSHAGKAPICVLFYHRVADEHPNEWTISNREFARQIGWLGRHFDMISLGEAQRRIKTEQNDRVAVCVTFDDGYADNCAEAIPLLIEEGIPCTYFVSLGFLQESTPFPHDVAAGQPLAPNTLQQIKHMANAGIEIGAHTRTHPDLGKVEDPERLIDEVVSVRDELQSITAQTIRYFAFPYGLPANLNDKVFQLAREAGYAGVCSAYGNYNLPGKEPFHLERIHADPEFIRLKNWVTLDPRKWGRVQQYEFRSAGTTASAEPRQVAKFPRIHEASEFPFSDEPWSGEPTNDI